MEINSRDKPKKEELDEKEKLRATEIFSNIQKGRLWGTAGLGSGPGSEPQYCIDYILKLSKFMQDHKVKSVVDVGCGDWQFSQYVNWDGIQYLGMDCVKALIDHHRNKYEKSSNIHFQLGDVFEVLDKDSFPTCDLILLKDVIMHWSNQAIYTYLPLLQKKCKYLFITNNNFQVIDNEDAPLGGYRALHFSKKPLSEFKAEFYASIKSHTPKDIVVIKGFQSST